MGSATSVPHSPEVDGSAMGSSKPRGKQQREKDTNESLCLGKIDIYESESPRRVYSPSKHIGLPLKLLCNQAIYLREIKEQREIIRSLRNQLRDAQRHHSEFCQSPDLHLENLRREWKASERTLMQKQEEQLKEIKRLRQCRLDEAEDARERIDRLERSEQELLQTVRRMQKERQASINHREDMLKDAESVMLEKDKLGTMLAMLRDTNTRLKRRNECLDEDIKFLRKVQEEDEERNHQDLKSISGKLRSLKVLSEQVENRSSDLELKNASLQQELVSLQQKESNYKEILRVRNEELHSKTNMVWVLEASLRKLKAKLTNNCKSLAEELDSQLLQQGEQKEDANFNSETHGNSDLCISNSQHKQAPYKTNLKGTRFILGETVLFVEACPDFESSSANFTESMTHQIENLADEVLTTTNIVPEETLYNIRQMYDDPLEVSLSMISKDVILKESDMSLEGDKTPLITQESCESIVKERSKEKSKQKSNPFVSGFNMLRRFIKGLGVLARIAKVRKEKNVKNVGVKWSVFRANRRKNNNRNKLNDGYSRSSGNNRKNGNNRNSGRSNRRNRRGYGRNLARSSSTYVMITCGARLRRMFRNVSARCICIGCRLNQSVSKDSLKMLFSRNSTDNQRSISMTSFAVSHISEKPLLVLFDRTTKSQLKPINQRTQRKITGVDCAIQFDAEDFRKRQWQLIPRDAEDVKELMQAGLKQAAAVKKPKFTQCLVKPPYTCATFQDNVDSLQHFICSELFSDNASVKKEKFAIIGNKSSYLQTISALRELQNIETPFKILLPDWSRERVIITQILESNICCTVYPCPIKSIEQALDLIHLSDIEEESKKNFLSIE